MKRGCRGASRSRSGLLFSVFSFTEGQAVHDLLKIGVSDLVPFDGDQVFCRDIAFQALIFTVQEAGSLRVVRAAIQPGRRLAPGGPRLSLPALAEGFSRRKTCLQFTARMSGERVCVPSAGADGNDESTFSIEKYG